MFKNKLIKNNNLNFNYNIFIHGYVGMHLNNAGISYIDDVIYNKPDYCFIDWFSTGYISLTCIYKYLDTIMYKLNSINCQAIFLLFDSKNLNQERLKMYYVVIEYAKKYNIYYISLFNNENKNELLRDEVHTTDIGSEYYGNNIYENFLDNILNKKMPTINVLKNELCNIQVYDYNKIIYDKITISGNAKIIGILQNVGPFSGKIKLEYNNLTEFQTIWDIYCHYERDNILISVLFNGKLTIHNLNENIDTSLARRQIDWNTYNKCLKLKKIFYIGELRINENETN